MSKIAKVLPVVMGVNPALYDDFSGSALSGRWTAPTWSISGGKAVNAPTPGVDKVTNGGFDEDSGWGKDPSWSIGSGVATKVASVGSEAISQNSILTIGIWYLIQYTIASRTAGGFTPNLSGSTYYETTTGVKYHTGRTSGVALTIYGNAAGAGTIDDVSAKPYTLAQLFASYNAKRANVTIKAALTNVLGTMSGLVTCLNSATAPTYFLLAYTDGTYGWLDKYLNGTYTNLIKSSVTYGDGKVLKVIKSGLSVSLYYGTAGSEAQVGSTQTLSATTDAGIVSNTLHGMFSAYSGNQLDNFSCQA